MWAGDTVLAGEDKFKGKLKGLCKSSACLAKRDIRGAAAAVGDFSEDGER